MVEDSRFLSKVPFVYLPAIRPISRQLLGAFDDLVVGVGPADHGPERVVVQADTQLTAVSTPDV